MIKAAVAAAVLLAVGSPAFAQSEKRPMSAQAIAETQPLIDGFFRTLQAGDASKAYTELFANTLMAAKALEIQNLVAQTNFIFQTYGAIKGWSLAESDCITPTLCRTIYQIDTDNGPVILSLTLYRRSSGWMPTTIFVTDQTQSLFN
ncbi:hypothetical protein [uncultured Brevundimonas sp.]|uniref:hypothetical protein n=1 Tax=uncultured Brevundimonas sp. TaxID=213418 RepID=UPI0025ED13C6|nr:hypothetical protein [uncultured Brevundimonas sp.]